MGALCPYLAFAHLQGVIYAEHLVANAGQESCTASDAREL